MKELSEFASSHQDLTGVVGKGFEEREGLGEEVACACFPVRERGCSIVIDRGSAFGYVVEYVLEALRKA